MSNRTSTVALSRCTPDTMRSLNSNGAAELQPIPKSGHDLSEPEDWRKAELRLKYAAPDAYEPDEVDE